MRQDFSARKAVGDDCLGLRVERDPVDAGATAWGDHTPSPIFPLFNVVGGRVRITQLLMEITTDLSNDAALINFCFTPTGGARVDLSAASATVAQKAAGTRIAIAGTIGGATTFLADVGVSLLPLAAPYVLGLVGAGRIGTGGEIGIRTTIATLASGAAKWSVWYIPMDADSAVVPASAVCHA